MNAMGQWYALMLLLGYYWSTSDGAGTVLFFQAAHLCWSDAAELYGILRWGSLWFEAPSRSDLDISRFRDLLNSELLDSGLSRLGDSLNSAVARLGDMISTWRFARLGVMAGGCFVVDPVYRAENASRFQ